MPLQSYTFSEEILQGWQTSDIESWVDDYSTLGKLPLLVYTRLGDTCLGRLSDFMKWPDGWGDGGRAIAESTLVHLQKFLETGSFPIASSASLFLRSSGALELLFRNSLNQPVRIVFDPDGLRHLDGSEDGNRVLAERIREFSEALSSELR